MNASDSRLMREAARPGTGLDPKDESGGARERNRPTLSIPYITTKPLPPSNPDVWPEDEWKRICRIWRGEEE